jgi:hypothetical protein
MFFAPGVCYIFLNTALDGLPLSRPMLAVVAGGAEAGTAKLKKIFLYRP